MGNSTQLGRLQEVAGIFSQLLFPSTFFFAVLIPTHESHSHTLRIIVIASYICTVLFTLMLLARNYKRYIFLLAIAYITFYMSLVYDLWRLYEVKSQDGVIISVKHPFTAVIAFSCFGIILIQIAAFLLVWGKSQGLLECPIRCIILTFAQVLILPLIAGLIYTGTQGISTNLLPIGFYLLASVLIIGQLLILFLYDSLGDAAHGLVDSFRWRYLKSTPKWTIFTYTVVMVLSGIITSSAGAWYQFKGLRKNEIWAFSLGFYNGLTLLFLGGILGHLISRIIRTCRPVRPRHNRRVIAIQDEQNENRINIEFNDDEYGYQQLNENGNIRRESNIAELVAGMQEHRFLKEGQRNYECPICLDAFDDINHVTVHEVCQNGFHTPCLGDWLQRGHRTCPLCRVQII